MEACIFRRHLEILEEIDEETSYLEIANYTDPSLNICEEHTLPRDDILSFVRGEGRFSPRPLPENAQLLSRTRLVLQKSATHPDVFSPNKISFPRNVYQDMLTAMKLPLLVAETSAVVSPFFWTRYLEVDNETYLQIIFRKADVQKKGNTRGWEFLISYSLQRMETVGIARGTETKCVMADCIDDLRACAAQIGHPLILPVLALARHLSSEVEIRNRESRQWLPQIEHTVGGEGYYYVPDRYLSPDGSRNLDALTREITQCSAKAMWTPAPANRKVVHRMTAATHWFWDTLSPEGKTAGMRDLHARILERLDFHLVRLDGIEVYSTATMQHLDAQRNNVQFITADIAQKDAKLNLKIAGEQRRLAHAAARDSKSMKGLSLLGATFLPGTFLASIFSMSFFDFGPQPGGPPVSSSLWIFVALAVPLTGIVVFGWLWWERARQRQLARDEAELEESIQDMEKSTLAELRH